MTYYHPTHLPTQYTQIAPAGAINYFGSRKGSGIHSIEATLTYTDYPTEHWNRIRTNNTIERVNREIKRRTRAIGAFPDGQSALMLVCARLRHVAASDWGSKRYLNMNHLFELEFQRNIENFDATR